MGYVRSEKGRAVEIALLVLVALVVLWEGIRFVTTLGDEIGAAEAGIFLIVLAGLLALLTIVYGVQLRLELARVREGDRAADAPQEGSQAGGSEHRSALLGIGLFFGFVLMLNYIDYAVAAFVFLAAHLRLFGRYPWPVVVLTAAAIAFGSAYLWNLLGVAMPRHDFPFVF